MYQMATEGEVDEQIGQGLQLVPSDTAWGPSSTSYVLPTPESLALADRPTPALEEVDAAWPAPSNDNADAADAWGTGITAIPNTHYSDGWGADSKPTAAGNEANGDKADNNWSGGGGWKSDKAWNCDQGYVIGSFWRDRPFWQPPKSDSGCDGFRKRTGYVNWNIYFFLKLIISPGLRYSFQGYGSQNDEQSSNNGKGYSTRTTVHNAADSAWRRAIYVTTNDPTWVRGAPRTSRQAEASRQSPRSKSRSRRRRRRGLFLKQGMPGTCRAL